MIRKMLLLLKSNEYDKVSLSVQKENYALQIYLNVGFEIIDENEDEYIMVCYL
ncbi:MAG: hypothetical protein Q607_CBUC00203G0001 [Clostridium butyricum DORA_1]|nr:MAG: hypothetical protein Q607_CBUC00203G0001 [Clostridium butyricum DORA_1]